MDSKSIFQSKTLWLNILGPIFLWLGAKYGLQLDADTQGAIVTVLMLIANVGMRLVTTGPVHVVASSSTDATPPAQKQAGFSTLRLAGSIVGFGCLLAIASCAITGLSPAQREYLALEIGVAVESIATETESQAGLSPADVADIKAAKQVFLGAMQSAAINLGANSTVTTTLTGAGEAGAIAAVNQIAGVLNQKHGASTNIQALLVATSLDVLGQLPAVVGTYTALEGGLDPTQVDPSNSANLTYLAEAQAALTAAAAN